MLNKININPYDFIWKSSFHVLEVFFLLEGQLKVNMYGIGIAKMCISYLDCRRVFLLVLVVKVLLLKFVVIHLRTNTFLFLIVPKISK